MIAAQSSRGRDKWWVGIVVIAFFAALFFLNGRDTYDRMHYAGTDPFFDLANAFVHGRLDFPQYLHDSVIFKGKYYWPLGPLPAILLVPQALFSTVSNQSIPSATMHTAGVVVIFLLLFFLARAKHFSRHDAAWCALAFCGASLFIGVAMFPVSWYTAHVVTVLALVAALYEDATRKRWWLIGVFLAGGLLTRATAWIGIVFFLCTIFFNGASWRTRVQQWTVLLLPSLIAFLLLFFYNFARFGDPFEMGYRFQHLDDPALAAARGYGLFSLQHLPGNLYNLFLVGPNPVFMDTASHVLRFPYLSFNPWGFGIFFTTPYLLLLFLEPLRSREQRLLLLTSVLIAIPLLLYYGIGYFQYGYRYALDFFPFLFMMVLNILSARRRPLSPRFKVLVTVSFCAQLFLLIVYKFQLA